MSARTRKPPQVAFCPQDGRLDKVDEDGLCPHCGATCMGDEIDALIYDHEHLQRQLATARDEGIEIAAKHLDDKEKWGALGPRFAATVRQLKSKP